jgi:hypothetical protein
MALMCAGVAITPDALARVSVAAREWSTRPDLTEGQQAMARSLEQHAAVLATASTTLSGKDVAVVKKLCCQLFAAVNRGEKPGPTKWPCSPRA